MDSPSVIFFLVLTILQQHCSCHHVSGHSQNETNTTTTSSTIGKPSEKAMTNDTITKATASERTENEEVERWVVPFQFSPIWLEEISKSAGETAQQNNGNNEVAEAVVVENEYNNNNKDDQGGQPEEQGDLEQVRSLDEGELEDGNDDDNDDDDDDENGEEDELEDGDVIIQESVGDEEKLPSDSQTTDLPPDQVDVEVKEWNEPPIQPVESANDNAIDSANSVSAPWYDVMAIGLPPSVAYNWQFLMDLSEKLRTAPRTKTTKGTNNDDSFDSAEYNTRLKYLLTRVRNIQSTQSSPVELDNLKQQHLLKSKLTGLSANGDDDILTWAWRRAVPLQ